MGSVLEYIMQEAARHLTQYGKELESIALSDEMFYSFINEMGATYATYLGAPAPAFTEYKVYTIGGSVIVTRNSHSNVIQKQFNQELEQILEDSDGEETKK